MKDVYKDAMGAVKAPDALVEKTLRRMLEEHKKLEAKAEENAEPKEPRDAAAHRRGSTVRPLADARQDARHAAYRANQTPPRKNRWGTRVALPVAACLCLLLSVTVPRLFNREPDMPPALVAASYGPSLGTPTPTTYNTEMPSESVMQALAIENLATRSGPAADYRESGTYAIKGEQVRVISRAYDANGLCWVQCEVRQGNKLRRVYTGVKRLDAATFNLDGVPEETPRNTPAKAAASAKALYGPGEGYDAYAELTVDEGQTVIIITIEHDYAQVEWKTATQSYRAWVPIDSLNLL